MKEKINNIYENGDIKIYFIVKSYQNNKVYRELKSLNASRDVNNRIKTVIEKPLCNFLEKMDSMKPFKDCYDNTKSLYELTDEIFNPFDFFKDTDENVVYGHDIVDGFAIKFAIDDDAFWIYQNIYQNAIIKSNNKATLSYDGGTYNIVKNDLVLFEKRIDAIKIDNITLIENYKVIEQKFDYQIAIRKIVSEVISELEKAELVQDIGKIREVSGDDKITFAKKLMKVKDSPVLKVPKNELINRVSKMDNFSKLIKNGSFVIDSKNKANQFVKLLNDQFLRSELTGELYDAQVKTKVERVEE